MTHYRSFRFIICFCVYLTLIVTIVVTDKDAINTKILPPNAVAESLNGSKGRDVPEDNSECDDICSTPECIRTASRILRNIDSNVEPCDDFYKFSCGGFLNSTIIEDKLFFGTSSITRNTVMEQLRTTIEEESSPNEPRIFRLAKDLYKACMNKTAIEERGLQPLLDNLRKLGGWPVLDGDRWNEGDFNWTDSVYKFRKLGYSINHFISFDVRIDSRNSSKHIIHLDRATFDFPLIDLARGFNSTLVQIYYSFMVDIAEILGVNRDRATTELKESLEFEIQLAKISSLRWGPRKVLHKRMKINKLSTAYPSIPWLEYLNTILAPQAQLNRNEIVIVNPSYLKNFEVLINRTSKRIQANYALWRAVVASIDYLTDDVRKRYQKYLIKLSGINENIEIVSRWKECIGFISDNLAISFRSMYVRKYFNEDAKKTVMEMVGDVRNAFKKILEKLEWMDEKTRATALEKAASMTSYVAYEDDLLDIRKLDEFYKKLKLSADDYLGSFLNFSVFEIDLSFARLRIPVNETEWITHEKHAIIHAYYAYKKNSILISAAILQGIYFNNAQPRYMNYGAMGFVIGHEITHGFDHTGRQLDKEGNHLDWWKPETKKNYLNRTECIINQYGNYTAEDVGINLNGKNTLNENIADNGGMKAAYYAYKEWVKRNGREQRLPGLPYTPEQMFWISTANRWCTKYDKKVMLHLILNDRHSLNEFRVQGTLSNMEEFSQDFNCPNGTKMNPVEKCAVW